MKRSILRCLTLLSCAGAIGGCAVENGRQDLVTADAVQDSSAALAGIEADPSVADIIRMMSPTCRDSSPECQLRRLEAANENSRRGLSWVTVATDSAGDTYAILRKDLIGPANPRPRIWILGTHRNSAVAYRFSTTLWQLDCSLRTYAQVAKIRYRDDGSVASSQIGNGSAVRAEPDTVHDRWIGEACNR